MCIHKYNNPLVFAGLIQQANLSDILSTPGETPSTKHRRITEAQLMTADEYHKTMEEKNREASGKKKIRKRGKKAKKQKRKQNKAEKE